MLFRSPVQVSACASNQLPIAAPDARKETHVLLELLLPLVHELLLPRSLLLRPGDLLLRRLLRLLKLRILRSQPIKRLVLRLDRLDAPSDPLLDMEQLPKQVLHDRLLLLRLESAESLRLLLHLLVLLDLAVDALAARVLGDGGFGRFGEGGGGGVVGFLEVERAGDLVDELGEVLGGLGRDGFDVALRETLVGAGGGV